MSDACSGACSNAFRQNTIPGQLARRVKLSNAAAKNESKMKAFPVQVLVLVETASAFRDKPFQFLIKQKEDQLAPCSPAGVPQYTSPT